VGYVLLRTTNARLIASTVINYPKIAFVRLARSEGALRNTPEGLPLLSLRIVETDTHTRGIGIKAVDALSALKSGENVNAPPLF
jgi:hypothetical protein